MFIVNEQGNIELYQGDSGMLTVEDLPTDKDYTVYFSMYDNKRNIIGFELNINAYAGTTPNTIRYKSVTFAIPASLTDLLTVPKGEDTAEYYYGLKICESGTNMEDTLVINDGDIGDINTITVYPKKVEGLV